ncbi:MFS transporter [Fervidobacterium pennivorans subsp. keratinolyticus]|nr:MFS transporter [Fervidobacterium pennivorans subsp. keratinolyticus]
MENLYPMLVIFSYSLVLNSMPPLLSSFRELFNISIALSSFLPFFSLAGTVISNIFTGIFLNKLGIKRALLTGYFLTIVGALIVAFSGNYLLSILGLFIFGLSTGFGFTGSTTLLSQAKNPNFGFYHGAYGIGGILAPFCISWATRNLGDFRDVYLMYAMMFLLLVFYTVIKTFPILHSVQGAFSLRGISNAFRNADFLIFLSLLILYSSVEIGVITWAGVVMKDVIISSYTAYALFWLTFTLSRFFTNYLEKVIPLLLRTNTVILGFTIFLFFWLRNPLFFALSGLLFGPLFPYIQKNALVRIKKEHLTLFNGATYAFTSLGGSIVSILMGVIIERNIFLALLVPLIIFISMELVSLKTGKVK